MNEHGRTDWVTVDKLEDLHKLRALLDHMEVQVNTAKTMLTSAVTLLEKVDDPMVAAATGLVRGALEKL